MDSARDKFFVWREKTPGIFRPFQHSFATLQMSHIVDQTLACSVHLVQIVLVILDADCAEIAAATACVKYDVIVF